MPEYGLPSETAGFIKTLQLSFGRLKRAGFEPSKEEIIQELIPKSLKIQVYKAVLESNASEHGVRMTAMDKATDNAGELIKALKLSYNRTRQGAITTEILEIVDGAEALAASR